jgi:hypothetical protein
MGWLCLYSFVVQPTKIPAKGRLLLESHLYPEKGKPISLLLQLYYYHICWIIFSCVFPGICGNPSPHSPDLYFVVLPMQIPDYGKIINWNKFGKQLVFSAMRVKGVKENKFHIWVRVWTFHLSRTGTFCLVAGCSIISGITGMDICNQIPRGQHMAFIALITGHHLQDRLEFILVMMYLSSGWIMGFWAATTNNCLSPDNKL